MRRKLKVTIIACLIFIFTGGGLFATGMPVIDVSAIAQAITEAVAAVQRWNQQLNQWKSEYDRLKAASEKIASGDFTAIVTGIGNLAGQLSGWADYAGIGRAEDWLDSVEDGSYSLLGMLSNSKLLVANYEILEKQVSRNLERIQAEARNSGELIGDSLFESGSFSLKSMMNLLQNGGNAVISGANLYNDIVDLFNVTPAELAEIYDNSMNKALQSAGYTDKADLQKKIAELQKEISEASAELMDMNAESNPTKYNDKKAEIDEKKNRLATMQNLLAWAGEMETEKAKLIEQQKEYNAGKKDAEAVTTQKKKDEYEANLTAAFTAEVSAGVADDYASLAENVRKRRYTNSTSSNRN